MRKFRGVVVAIALTGGGCDGDDGIVIPPLDGPTGTAFDVTLRPSGEVPVCALAGIFATGATRVVIAHDNSTVQVINLTFTMLSGPATAAHIHADAPGIAGPIVFNLGTALTPPINATFTAANYPTAPPSGAPLSYATFIADMKAGDSYIDVHTAACPAGEIRAQLR